MAVINFTISVCIRSYQNVVVSIIAAIYLCIYLFAGSSVLILAWIWFAIAALSVVINIFRGSEGMIMIVCTIPEIVYLCITLF